MLFSNVRELSQAVTFPEKVAYVVPTEFSMPPVVIFFAM
jgi:hypothetical protein